jgi:hypothetical protein
MCPCRKVCAAVWGTVSPPSRILATALTSMLEFPRSIEAVILGDFLWRWDFPISWHQYHFRFSPIDGGFWVGFSRMQATFVVLISPECWGFLSGAYLYPSYGTSLRFSHAISSWFMQVTLTVLFFPLKKPRYIYNFPLFLLISNTERTKRRAKTVKGIM